MSSLLLSRLLHRKVVRLQINTLQERILLVAQYFTFRDSWPLSKTLGFYYDEMLFFRITLTSSAREKLWQVRTKFVTFNSIPPTYAPPRPPPTGKPLTNRQKIVLAVTILLLFLLLLIVVLLLRR